MTKNEYAENPPQIGAEGMEYSFSCQGLNRLKHPQKIQRRREMQLEHFTFMLIKHPEKSNADARRGISACVVNNTYRIGSKCETVSF